MNGLFEQAPDMSVMYPGDSIPIENVYNPMPMGPQQNPNMGDMSVQGGPQGIQTPQEMPIMNDVPDQEAIPFYTGHAIIDKYIHDFIGKK